MRTSSKARVIPRSSPRSLAAFLREAHALRLRSERSQAMFWSRRVNRPLGAIIAQGLLATSVSPNSVSIVGLIVHLVGAALVLAAPVPAPVPLVVTRSSISLTTPLWSFRWPRSSLGHSLFGLSSSPSSRRWFSRAVSSGFSPPPNATHC